MRKHFVHVGFIVSQDKLEHCLSFWSCKPKPSLLRGFYQWSLVEVRLIPVNGEKPQLQTHQIFSLSLTLRVLPYASILFSFPSSAHALFLTPISSPYIQFPLCIAPLCSSTLERIKALSYSHVCVCGSQFESASGPKPPT